MEKVSQLYKTENEKLSKDLSSHKVEIEVFFLMTVLFWEAS